VVLWDKLAKRWFVSQLGYDNNFNAFDLCIAVSQTADATGAYNRYAFSTGAISLTTPSIQSGQTPTTAPTTAAMELAPIPALLIARQCWREKRRP
jgi:hypothetical protein